MASRTFTKSDIIEYGLNHGLITAVEDKALDANVEVTVEDLQIQELKKQLEDLGLKIRVDVITVLQCVIDNQQFPDDLALGHEPPFDDEPPLTPEEAVYIATEYATFMFDSGDPRLDAIIAEKQKDPCFSRYDAWETEIAHFPEIPDFKKEK